MWKGEAEKEGAGTHVHLCSAQFSCLCALGLWPCATFQHCLSSPSGCAGMLLPVLAMLSSWQGSPTLFS